MEWCPALPGIGLGRLRFNAVGLSTRLQMHGVNRDPAAIKT